MNTQLGQQKLATATLPIEEDLATRNRPSTSTLPIKTYQTELRG